MTAIQGPHRPLGWRHDRVASGYSAEPLNPCTKETHDPTGAIPVPDPAPATAGGTGLETTEDFPADVTNLPLTHLHVLHSKLCRQLDHETLTNPAGPNPLTQDRHQEVITELDARAATGASQGTVH